MERNGGNYKVREINYLKKGNRKEDYDELDVKEKERNPTENCTRKCNKRKKRKIQTNSSFLCLPVLPED